MGIPANRATRSASDGVTARLPVATASWLLRSSVSQAPAGRCGCHGVATIGDSMTLQRDAPWPIVDGSAGCGQRAGQCRETQIATSD